MYRSKKAAFYSMGEAKRRASLTARLTDAHPRCVYCGAKSTTRDHCPPRCFFLNKHAPEGYEFAACANCQNESRLDELALSVLIRLTRRHLDDASVGELLKLIDGVKNNRPELAQEWMNILPARRKREMRDLFGSDADNLRYNGWNLLNLGPLSIAVIERFILKLGKALYYKHNQKLFDGVIYTHYINPLFIDNLPQQLSQILSKAPLAVALKRNGQSLSNQFNYRFNHSSEHEVFYSVVELSDQFLVQLFAVGWNMAEMLENSTDLPNSPKSPTFRFPCPLPPCSSPTDNLSDCTPS